MARILMAWELGANFGHVARQLQIALRLRQAGHEIVFAIRDTAAGEAGLTPHSFSYVQAPLHLGRVRLTRAPMNFSELLLAEGYGDRIALCGRLRAWMRLFELSGAQAVLVDHAPTALVAARAARLPAIQIGNGFEIPPRASPLPSIRPWKAVPDAQLLRSDSLVCRCINETLREVGAEPLQSVSDLFSCGARVIASFPELDHYEGREGDEYAGPLFGPIGSARTDWSSSDRPRIFAYLRNGVPGLGNLLAGFHDTDAEVICAFPGINTRLGRQLSKGNVRVFPHAVQLEPLLERADVVIHGGTGTAAQALLAGVPVLSLAGNIEQYLHARRIESLGAGIAIGPARQREDFVGALRRLISQGGFREKAGEFARRHAGFRPSQAAEYTYAVIERALAEGGAQLH
jgi:UDP:flavonoid glycosyltransferase YjiC (YdhE family)